MSPHMQNLCYYVVKSVFSHNLVTFLKNLFCRDLRVEKNYLRIVANIPKNYVIGFNRLPFLGRF